MIILGIDTATQQVGCSVGGVEGPLASFHSTRDRRHAETLAPAIDFVCAQARIELREISVVAVDIGPGLFTGLRVGMATAKAMAQALRVPMIGLSSLDLLAHQVRHSPRLIVPIIDARRGEVYFSFYRQVPGGVQREAEPRVGPATEVANELLARGEDALLVGDGAIRYSAVLEEALDRRLRVDAVGTAWPRATDLVELAQPQALREEWVQPWDIEPLYLRKSDAEINWDARGRLGS